MAPLGFSQEQLALRLAEAEALLAAHVSEPIRASWCWAVKLGEPPDLERFYAELNRARRGREALLAGDAVLSQDKQERLQALLRLEVALLRGIQALGESADPAAALRTALRNVAAGLERSSLPGDAAVALQLALEALLEKRPREALWPLKWMLREEGRARPWRRVQALLRALQEESWAERGDELPLEELRPLLEKALRLVRKEGTLQKTSPEEPELHRETLESGKTVQFQGLNLKSENPEERRNWPDYSRDLLFSGIFHEDPSQDTFSGNGKSAFVGSSVSSEVEEPVEPRTQVLVSLEEVAVCFSEDEWSLLDPVQKDLYRDVMLENSRNVAFLEQWWRAYGTRARGGMQSPLCGHASPRQVAFWPKADFPFTKWGGKMDRLTAVADLPDHVAQAQLLPDLRHCSQTLAAAPGPLPLACHRRSGPASPAIANRTQLLLPSPVGPSCSWTLPAAPRPCPLACHRQSGPAAPAIADRAQLLLPSPIGPSCSWTLPAAPRSRPLACHRQSGPAVPAIANRAQLLLPSPIKPSCSQTLPAASRPHPLACCSRSGPATPAITDWAQLLPDLACLPAIAVVATPSLEHPEMSAAKKAKTGSGRSFQEAWTESFGVIEHNGRALCTLCNESVVCRTSSVRRHFDTNHKSVAKFDATERKEFLEWKLRTYHSQSLSFSNNLSRTNHLTAASFQISLCLAKHGKPLSDGDTIKTAMLSKCNSLFCDFPNKDKIIKRISEVPLSRNTVKDRVQRMASDVNQQLTTDLQKAACYSMCLAESTDANNHARLAVILRYAAGDIMREELVKLVSLPERTQGIDIYSAVMEAFLSQDIRPEKVVSITSDGAPSMVGTTSGFIQFFTEETKHQVIQFHCIIHQEALCARGSSNKFNDVLKDVTKMVNYIMPHALNFQQFKALLEEVQVQYNCLLMYNNVRWLSRGRVLERFVACLDEIRLFMNEKGQGYPQLTDMAWLTNLMFFTDFTVHFNVLNKQLQGVGKTAERMFCDIKTFERKLQVFERDLESGQLKYFPNLKMHLENSTTFADNPTSHQEIYKEFSSIVAAAKVNFSNRFLQFRKMETTLYYLTSPDKAKFEELDLISLHWLDIENLEMELLEFQENSIWKNKFCDLRETLEKIERMTKDSKVTSGTVSSENEILKVWNSLPNNFNSMKALGIAFLTLFGSSYACEQLFSALNYIKPDTRNKLTDDLTAACVALKITKYEPRLEKLSACIQQQKSH